MSAHAFQPEGPLAAARGCFAGAVVAVSLWCLFLGAGYAAYRLIGGVL